MVKARIKEYVLLLCFVGIATAAVIQNSQPIESNAAVVAKQIASEDNKSNDENSDLETAEFKHGFRRKFAYAVPVAVPVAPVYVQPVPVAVQPIPIPVQPVPYPVQYQHAHTPDCGCNRGGYNGYQSYGYNYNYHYNY